MATPNNYILVVRFPTGGIRTHIKYGAALATADNRRPKPILVCPDDREGEAIMRALSLPKSRFAANGARSAFDLAMSTAKACLKYRAKVIHSHGFTSAMAAAPTALLAFRRHIVTVHDVVTPGLLATMPRAALFLLGIVLRLSYAIHAVGDDCASSLRGIPFLRNARNIVTIPNGIDVEQFSNVEPRPIRAELGLHPNVMLVGFFGRFMAQKGFRTLVDAMALLRSMPSAAPVHVVAVGAGGFIREDKAYITKLGLLERFHFIDAVENPAPFIAGVDAVVMPSRWEAYPLLAAEALTLGVPLVASTCIGLREVTKGSPAAVFEPGDSGALASAICRESAHPTSAAAKSYVPAAKQRFDFTSGANRIDAILIAANEGEPLPLTSLTATP